MPYTIHSATAKGLEDILNGVVLLGPFPSTGLPLGALTVVFNTPVQTVTFSGAAGARLTLADIVDEINTAVGEDVASYRTGVGQAGASPTGAGIASNLVIAIQRDAGFVIDTAGTANALLRIDSAVDTTSAGVVAAADILGFTAGATPGHYTVILAP